MYSSQFWFYGDHQNITNNDTFIIYNGQVINDSSMTIHTSERDINKCNERLWIAVT